MRAHRAEFRIATMARVLGVSTSGYYAWLKRPRSAREKADSALAERVRAIHEQSRGTYGAPRIRAELADQGFSVSRKRVARLMHAEAKGELFRYIEGWYNTHRRHSAIGYRSPVNSEKSYREAA